MGGEPRRTVERTDKERQKDSRAGQSKRQRIGQSKRQSCGTVKKTVKRTVARDSQKDSQKDSEIGQPLTTDVDREQKRGSDMVKSRPIGGEREREEKRTRRIDDWNAT